MLFGALSSLKLCYKVKVGPTFPRAPHHSPSSEPSHLPRVRLCAIHGRCILKSRLNTTSELLLITAPQFAHCQLHHSHLIALCPPQHDQGAGGRGHPEGLTMHTFIARAHFGDAAYTERLRTLGFDSPDQDAFDFSKFFFVWLGLDFGRQSPWLGWVPSLHLNIGKLQHSCIKGLLPPFL